MATVFTPIRSPQALDDAKRFLNRHFRPWLVISDRSGFWSPADAAVWPQSNLDDADPRKLRLGFQLAPEGDERAYQEAVVRWLALHFGRLKAFPKLKFPWRRCFPLPSRGRVPYIVYAGTAGTETSPEDVPLLIGCLWESRFLFNDAELPDRLQKYVVDVHGFPTGVSDRFSILAQTRAELRALSATLGM